MKLARKDTLVQQMSATESLASVDTICVDKTGTLTDGNLALVGIEPAYVTDPGIAQRELARFAASAGERNRTLETIAGEYPGEPEAVTGEIPFSSEWKWSALTFNGGGESENLVLGAPDLRARLLEP